MRNIIFIGMLVATAFAAGWFTIQRNGENTVIEIDRAEIRHDAAAAIEKGRAILERERQYDAANYGQSQQYSPQQQTSPWGQENSPLPPAYNGPNYQSQQTQPVGYDYRQTQTYQSPAYQGQSYSPAPQPYPTQTYQGQTYPAQPAGYPGQNAANYQQPGYPVR